MRAPVPVYLFCKDIAVSNQPAMAQVDPVPWVGADSHGSCVSLPRQSLITFVNKHLNKLNLEVMELETQVSGVLG